MPLQSSGQIKLSEIATEFGGSAPHALSEYHDKGNAPASGEIQLAADFYGTSNLLSHSTTITNGEQTIKADIENRGFVGSSSRTVGTGNDHSGGTTSAVGSLGDTTITSGPTIQAIYKTMGIGVNTHMHLEFSGGTTNWTQIVIDGNTYTKAQASTSDNELWTWTDQAGLTQDGILRVDTPFNGSTSTFVLS